MKTIEELREQLSQLEEIRKSIDNSNDDIDTARNNIDNEILSLEDSIDTISKNSDDIDTAFDEISSSIDDLKDITDDMSILLDRLEQERKHDVVNSLLTIMKSMNDENGIINDLIALNSIYLDDRYENIDNKVYIFKLALESIKEGSDNND